MEAAQWPQRVEGERTSLVRFAEEPAAGWLAEAAQAIAGRAAPCRLEDRLAAGDVGWWIEGDGERVGALCGQLAPMTAETDDVALVWTWLAIAARWRAYGFGGAAVPLLEAAAAGLGASTALVPLPADNGVAFYFWLRLGYTPIRTAPIADPDRPAGLPADALWMTRPLST